MSDETIMNSVELIVDLAVAWLGNLNNKVDADEVQKFLRSTHATLVSLSEGKLSADPVEEEGSAQPEYPLAVSVRKSLASKDQIISMVKGKPYKTLRRHLSTHGMTPDSYRERYNLKEDYPMVAPNYSEQRRAMAHKIGLGAKGRAAKAVDCH